MAPIEKNWRSQNLDSPSIKDLFSVQSLASSNLSRYWILKLVFAIWKSVVCSFSIKLILKVVLKSKSPCCFWKKGELCYKQHVVKNRKSYALFQRHEALPLIRFVNWKLWQIATRHR